MRMYDKTKCPALIWHSDGHGGGQHGICGRPIKNEGHCGIHDPVKKRARDAAWINRAQAAIAAISDEAEEAIHEARRKERSQ